MAENYSAEEKKRIKMERLDKLKEVLRNRGAFKEDLKDSHRIDFDVLLDPYSPEFEERYALEDPPKENVVLSIKLKSAKRSMIIMGTFFTYHIAKFFLWRYGYFAKFFYYQRFLSFPVLAFAMIQNIKWTKRDYEKQGLLDYQMKRVRFEKDSRILEDVLKTKANMISHSQVREENEVKINELINR